MSRPPFDVDPRTPSHDDPSYAPDDEPERSPAVIAWLALFLLALAVAILAATSAPRSAATAIPAGDRTTDLPPSGNPSLPSEAPSSSGAGVRVDLSPSPHRIRATAPPTDAADIRAGWATFYCCTRGYGDAAVVALADSRYVPAGREPWGWARVSVLRDGWVVASETFPVVDHCACGDRRGTSTVVDLSTAAANELGLETRIGRTPGMWRVSVQVTR